MVWRGTSSCLGWVNLRVQVSLGTMVHWWVGDSLGTSLVKRLGQYHDAGVTEATRQTASQHGTKRVARTANASIPGVAKERKRLGPRALYPIGPRSKLIWTNGNQ